MKLVLMRDGFFCSHNRIVVKPNKSLSLRREGAGDAQMLGERNEVLYL